jgi:hypothetical protein
MPSPAGLITYILQCNYFVGFFSNGGQQGWSSEPECLPSVCTCLPKETFKQQVFRSRPSAPEVSGCAKISFRSVRHTGQGKSKDGHLPCPAYEYCNSGLFRGRDTEAKDSSMLNCSAPSVISHRSTGLKLVFSSFFTNLSAAPHLPGW